MKSIVLKYGTISGLLAAALMLITTFVENKTGFGSYYFAIGIAGIALAFIPLYLGIRITRQTMGEGSITFIKALNTGLLIVLISALFYAITWLVIYYWITPDFPDKQAAYTLADMKRIGSPQTEIDAMMKALADNKERMKNPFLNFAITYTEPLPVGIVMALICALILKRKPGNGNQDFKPMKDLPRN